ncbi:efflux transporter outer membrane subunit [Roseateles sp. BYS87W]|uniref:Efflux transporter outer membrane subunit n=1 Tax=Pelomonas baiyunensis TaxID=3299026 RepID=A0ABW7H3L5_9BURK
MTPPFRLAALALALPLLLAACTTPTPVAPPTPAAVPAAWRSPLPHGGSTAALADWWQAFGDPALTRLIARAEAQSPTLEQAAARRRQAQAGAAQARAGLLPQGGLTTQVQRGRTLNGVAGDSTQSHTQFTASWEIDLFGGQRAAALAATAQAGAASADWHAARVSLAADVAQAYVQLRLAQAREESAELDTRFAEQMSAWARQQQAAGLMSASDAALLNTERAAAAAARSAARAEAQIALNALAQLCAERAEVLATELAPPAVVPTGFEIHRTQPRAPAFTLDGVPAQALAQRPDLAAAHQRWLAAAHTTRSVDAQRYPQLSLGALAGQTRISGTAKPSQSTLWAVGPSLSLPLFDGGALVAAGDAARAATDEAAAALQAQWLVAVQEVEDALQRVTAGAEREREVDAVRLEWEGIARRSHAQALAGLQSGLQRNTTFRNALTAHDVALGVRAEHALAWIRLYRALGGGWNAASLATPDTPAPNTAR